MDPSPCAPAVVNLPPSESVAVRPPPQLMISWKGQPLIVSPAQSMVMPFLAETIGDGFMNGIAEPPAGAEPYASPQDDDRDDRPEGPPCRPCHDASPQDTGAPNGRTVHLPSTRAMWRKMESSSLGVAFGDRDATHFDGGRTERKDGREHLGVRLRLADVEPRLSISEGNAGADARRPTRPLRSFNALSRHTGKPGLGVRSRSRRLLSWRCL